MGDGRWEIGARGPAVAQGYGVASRGHKSHVTRHMPLRFSSFQRKTRFVGPILQADLSFCSVRRALFADFRFRAGQISGVVLNRSARNSNPGHDQESVPGGKHIAQSRGKKIGDRAIQNFLRKRRVRPECSVRVVAMCAYQCRELHEGNPP